MNEDKSKKQLLDELTKLRQRIAELEVKENERRRAEEKIEHLSLTLRAIRNVNQLITKEKNRTLLLKGICDILTATRSYYNAWIALLDKSGGFKTAFESGLGKDFLPLVEQFKRGELTDCCRRALNQAEVVVTRDPHLACPDCPLAKMCGDRGGLTARLEHGGKVYGLLAASIRLVHIEDAEEQTLFQEVANDIGLALNNIEMEEERRWAEEELKRSKEYLESLNDSLSEVILTVDIPDNIDNRTVRYVNKAVEKIFGYRQKELLGKSLVAQYASKEDYFKANKFLKSAISRGTKVIHRELLLKRKSGETFPAELTTTFLRTRGKVTQIISIIRDITERKKAEEALHLRAHLLNEATDSIIATDLHGNLIYMNEATCRTRGYSKEEMLNMNLKQLVPPHITSLVDKRLRRIKKEGTIIFDSEHLRKDGGVFPIETTARTVNLGDRTIILSVIRDITERKKAEEAFRESEEMYRALLELGERIGEAVVLLQDDERGIGMHVYASDEWVRITGYSREELFNTPMADLIHPRDRKEAIKRHEKRIRGEVLPKFYELTIVRKDGTEVPVEVTYAYSSYKGKPANVGYIRDISERKKMEEQLIVTDRLASIGELASGIAHELNNPLTGIIGFSELLLKKDVPEDVKEDLQIINREAQRTAQVVKNLLTFARKHETTKQLVDINEAIKSVLDLRAYEQKVHNIAIVTNFDPGLPEITADIFRLQQVFINIIINAEYFMVQSHGRGTLTITTERRGDAIRASFANDGPGIKKEHLRHLFNPFFTTKAVGQGTGLGLSICHGIVTEHGGQVHAESEPGKGATFIVELPIK